MTHSENSNVRLDDIQSITLTNTTGDSATILTLGATLAQFNVYTGSAEPVNVVLGYPQQAGYLNDTAYLGATAGRYCNRIANSRFTIGTNTYLLDSNEGAHQLHGGTRGFHCRLWNILEQNPSSATLGLVSDDGDQGFPGKLDVTLRYELNAHACLDISWHATSNQDTVVCLTNHSYFNLAGGGDIRHHQLRIPATHYTPVNAELIPTGALLPVAGTLFDQQAFTKLNAVLDSTDPEIKAHGGLDHNWARGQAGEMLPSAEVFCPASELLLQASSTLPGLQCYTGNHLADNGVHSAHEGICLEPQYYPNSPNEPGFPSPLLRAGDYMRHRIRYQVTKSATPA